jgi:hypothetical protein
MSSYDFDRAERRLLENATATLPALAVAKHTTEVLAEMIAATTIPPVAEQEPPSSYYKRVASLQLSVIALRTARACFLVISAGYMPEAQALKRRLSEAHARAQAVAHDESGEHARQWLEGKTPKPTPIMMKFASEDLWALYSQSTHADARGVHQWLSMRLADGSDVRTGLALTPMRDGLSDAMLTEVAIECRDLALAMAVCHSMQGNQVRDAMGYVQAELDGPVTEAIRTYYVPVTADTDQTS